MVKNKWTEEDIRFLRDNYHKLTINECSDIMNRSVNSIYLKANRLELRIQNDWTLDECKYLSDNYIHLTHIELSKNLKRSIRSIKSKANKIGLSQYTTKSFILKSNNIHNYNYDYSSVIYKHSQQNVTIICNTHGKFKQTPESHLRGRGCPICKESKGEKEISLLLNKHKINFIREYKFDDCIDKGKLPFDFYIPDNNTCIEFNGEQHYIPIKWFGGKKTLDGIQRRDKIKKEYCIKNNIKLLTIKYSDNIKEMLTTLF